MPRRTTTSYAILGLLALRSWTTYELAKQVQRSLKWFWPRAERKLYDEPKNLVADGFATARSEQTGKRPRTVYDITPQGREELARWLGEAPAERSGEFEGMVKIFFSDSGSLDQLRATLGRVEEEAADRVRALGELAAAPHVFPARAHIRALSLRMYLDQELSVLRWSRWALEQVEQWKSTTDPGDWDSQAVLDAIAAGSEAEFPTS
jgi:DNA-binding PadR family transcriptional regulator